MGALTAQKYLEQSDAAGLALLAPVPPQGLLPVMALVAARHPRVFAEVNLFLHTGRATKDGLRQALFGGALPPERLDRYLAGLQRESLRAMWDCMLFDLPRPWRMRRVPTVVLGAERDRLVPPEMAQLCAATLAAPYETFRGMGHAMMLDIGWEKVADRLIAWLATHA
jgi:pimeloyl-ACP methyl ester carboxylesterase